MTVVQNMTSWLLTNRRSNYFRKYNEQVARQFLEDSTQVQQIRLKRLLASAARNTEYYREIIRQTQLWRNNSFELDNTEEIQQLPLLSKEIIRQEEMRLCDRQKLKAATSTTSGGSTGEPVRIYRDGAYESQRRASALQGLLWHGLGPYGSLVKLWGAERDLESSQLRWLDQGKDFLKNRTILNAYKMSEETMTRYLKIISDRRPDLIVSYAQSIFEISRFAKQNRIAVAPQKGIQTTATTLDELMRAEIEEVFSAPVYNHYGSREVGPVAAECSARDGLHVFVHHNFVEVLADDGTPCTPGQEGEIVVTNLSNAVMPLIRYRIGDRGVLRDPSELCSCGVRYPKLDRVTGRTLDVLVNKNGDRIAGHYFNRVLWPVDDVLRFQILQEDYDKLTFNLVTRNGTLESELLNTIETKTKVVMGKDCLIKFNFVDDIQVTKTGKQRYVVSKMAQKKS